MTSVENNVELVTLVNRLLWVDLMLESQETEVTDVRDSLKLTLSLLSKKCDWSAVEDLHFCADGTVEMAEVDQ